jgi:L-fucose mutarotase
MLKGISPLVGPDLLATLCRMGHGDDVVLADAHFPGETMGARVVRADGLHVADLLGAILPLFEVERGPGALVMMAPSGDDVLDPKVEEAFLAPIRKHAPKAPPIARIERGAFYARARQAFAVVMTGETAPYGNIILKKGVTPLG